jgi:hypothetical protein
MKKLTSSIVVTMAVALTGLGLAAPASGDTGFNGPVSITIADTKGCLTSLSYKVSGGFLWSLRIELTPADRGNGQPVRSGVTSGQNSESGTFNLKLCTPGGYIGKAYLVALDPDGYPGEPIIASVMFIIGPDAFPPSKKIKSTIEISHTSTTVVAKLSHNGKLTLQSHRGHNPWTKVTTIATVAGAASIKVKAQRTTFYRWVFSGNANYAPVTSAQTKIKKGE